MCRVPQINAVSIHRRLDAFSQAMFLGNFLFLKITFKSFPSLRSNLLISNILISLELFSNNNSLLWLSLWIIYHLSIIYEQGLLRNTSGFHPPLGSEVLPAVISNFSGTSFRRTFDYSGFAPCIDKLIQTPEALALLALHLLIIA